MLEDYEMKNIVYVCLDPIEHILCQLSDEDQKELVDFFYEAFKNNYKEVE